MADNMKRLVHLLEIIRMASANGAVKREQIGNAVFVSGTTSKKKAIAWAEKCEHDTQEAANEILDLFQANCEHSWMTWETSNQLLAECSRCGETHSESR